MSIEPESHEKSEPRADSAPLRRSPSRAPVWGLGLALAALGLLLAIQLQRASELAGEVESLSVKLATSQRLVEAYQERMDAVRDRVGELSEQIGSLRGLVSQDLEPLVPGDSPAP